jgi:hypothetical protein
MMKNFSLNRMIILIVAAGFAFLLADTILEHFEAVNHHRLAILPIAFSFIGLVLAFITALRWQKPALRALHVFLMLAALLGLGGMFLHNSERFEAKEHVVAAEGMKNEGEGEKRPGKKHFPPILAPMAFVGIAAVGLLGTSRRWGAEPQ